MKILRHQNIEGMARVGFTSDSYEVYVNTDDGGKIPHFHYRLKNDWNKFHICIKIESPEYFLHTGKESLLNSKQIRSLIRFLKSSVSLSQYSEKFSNNFELIIFLWNINNSDVIVDPETKIPDYYQLN